MCNDVMYRLLYMTSKKYNHIKGGFIHVPFAVQQVTGYGDGMASWEISTIAKGLEYAIEAKPQSLGWQLSTSAHSIKRSSTSSVPGMK